MSLLAERYLHEYSYLPNNKLPPRKMQNAASGLITNLISVISFSLSQAHVNNKLRNRITDYDICIMNAKNRHALQLTTRTHRALKPFLDFVVSLCNIVKH